jgi:hypothetical protein
MEPARSQDPETLFIGRFDKSVVITNRNRTAAAIARKSGDRFGAGLDVIRLRIRGASRTLGPTDNAKRGIHCFECSRHACSATDVSWFY